MNETKKVISAGFIVKSRDGKYLLGKAIVGGTACYTFFKGHQEENESLIETAARELKEETGIDIGADHRLSKNISTNPIYQYSIKNKEVILFLLHDVENVLDGFEFKCSSFWGEENKPEIVEYKWFDLDEMENNLFYSQRGVMTVLRKMEEVI